MDGLFLIGDFCFRLCWPEELALPENFMLFRTAAGEPEYSYRIQLTDRLPEPEGELIAQRPDIRVFFNHGLESRVIGVKGGDFYACYRETTERSAEIALLRREAENMRFDVMFTSLLALERRMARKDALILHCAYIRHQGEAILFSAPSETGKSTQADLWEKYRGSRTVNGDKALLQCVNGRWTARGWPVCGSSAICENLSTPVRAVVMLSQGQEDELRRLSPREAFTQLYSQITVNTWNRDFAGKNMALIEGLIARVPVFHLRCTISENAVRCLEKEIYPG